MPSIKDNLAATTDPAAANDLTEGYGIGSEWYNTQTGQMWKALSVASGAAQWMRLAPGPAWPPGTYRPPNYIYAVNDGQVAANKLTMMPLLIHRRVTVDRIALWLVTGQAGAEMRLGLYRTDGFTDAPGTLFAEAGTVDLSGGASLKTITMSWSLVPGQYWLAALNKSAGTLPTVRRAGGAVLGHVLGTDGNEIAGANAWRYLEAAQTYGSLPANAPAMTPSTGSDGAVLMLRRS